MTQQDQPDKSTAVTLFEIQLAKMQEVRLLDYKNPQFKSWLNTTLNLFQRFIALNNSHFLEFRDLEFHRQTRSRQLPYSYRGPIPATSALSQADRQAFYDDCALADACIRGAIEEIQTFGVHTEKPMQKSRERGGGFQQIFDGPVTIQNQAIATDRAIQKIGQMGDSGVRLRELAALLNESMELTGRERVEGLKAIEDIAKEEQKPEKHRDWKTILLGSRLLITIADKATDVGIKLAPHIPNIHKLIETAMKHLGT
jgi:hypothetical protein